uniref:Translocon Sec61/SecY plug domain-containing protein n=1 Tax=Oryza meridionalis TaxID=40149 RepID=A0A0E0FEI8_9ORYZ
MAVAAAIIGEAVAGGTRQQHGRRRKVLYTAVSLLIFLVAGELPLYGVKSYYYGSGDPRYWMNAMSASLRPTVMALGLVPLLYSEMAVHLSMALNIIGVHDDRLPTIDAASSLLGEGTEVVCDADSHRVDCCHCAIYMPPPLQEARHLLLLHSYVFVFQLIAGGLIAIYLDDLLRKGYGFLSGLSLFSAANCCACIFWKALNHACILMDDDACYFGLLFMLSIKYGETNKVVNMLGIWKEMRQYPGHYWPVSGIASYITTPLTVCSRSKRYLVRLLKKTQRTRVSPEQLLQEHDEDDSISPRRCRHYMTIAGYLVGICVGLLNLLALRSCLL